MLTCRDTNQKNELEGLLNMITNKNNNFDLAISLDGKIWFEFAKELYFDENNLFNKSTRNKSLIKMLKTAAILVSVSGVSSSTRFLSSNPNQLCDRKKNYYKGNKPKISST